MNSTKGLILVASCAVLGGALIIDPLYAVVAISGILFSVAALRYPPTIVYCLLVIVPFNDTITRFLHGSETTVFGALKDYLLALLILAALAQRRSGPRFLRTSIASLLGASVIGLILAHHIAASSYGFRNEIEPTLVLVSAPAILSRLAISRALRITMILGEVSAAIAILTWRDGLAWLERLHILPVPTGAPFPYQFFTSGNSRPRAFSPYVSADDLGLALTVILAIALFYPNLRPTWRFAGAALPMYAIYLSRSRSGILGAIVVLTIWAALTSESRIRRSSPIVVVLLILTAGVAVTWLAISHSVITGDTSTAGHLSSFGRGLNLVVHHPLGIGLGTAGPRAVKYFANPTLVESSFLLVGLELGWLGLVAYVALIYKLLRWFAAGYRQARVVNSDYTWIILVSTSALTGSIASQAVLPVVQDATVMFLLWTIVACGITALLLDRPLGATDPDNGDQLPGPIAPAESSVIGLKQLTALQPQARPTDDGGNPNFAKRRYGIR